MKILLFSCQNCGEIMTQCVPLFKQGMLLHLPEEEIKGNFLGRVNHCCFKKIFPTHNDKA